MRNLIEAYNLIQEFEGLKLHSYQDSVGVWTIGYGTTLGVYPGMSITPQQADSLMEIDVDHRASLIQHWVHVSLNDNELSAMISLAYNIGMGALNHSQLLFNLNQGEPKNECAKDFMHFTHAGGRILPGLVTRRQKEMQVFLA